MPIKLISRSKQLDIDFSEENGKTAIIEITDLNGEGYQSFYLTPKEIIEIKNYFEGHYDFHERLSEWLESQAKEIVTKEDLKSILECVKFVIMDCNRRANVAVETADRLSSIFERYEK